MPFPILESTYEIREEIGSGGGGVVYLAWHRRLEKLVVLKADRRGLSARTERLRAETDALKDLHHPYIPQVYDFIIENGTVYTVMDYIEGESLDKPLARGERFTQPQVVRWLRQLLEALVYLHGRPPYGILHSDIKPANIMLTPAGDISLIDFNIALALGAQGAVAIGASRGYASPEHYGPQEFLEATGRAPTFTDPEKTVALPGRETTVLQSGDARMSGTRGAWQLLDVRSDIYSLGATVYHLLSGSRPASKARAVLPLSGAYSPGLVQIIAKAMDPDPELRYQTAAEMLAAVNALHTSDPRYRRLIRLRRGLCAVCGALFLLGGAATFTGLKRMEQTKDDLIQAEYSSNALAQGDRKAALRYALCALPQKQGLLVPPPTAQAQKALSDALGIYQLKDGYEPAGILTLPGTPLMLCTAPQGELAAAVCAYEVVLFSPRSMQMLARLPAVHSALAEVEFVGDRLLLYAGERGLCAYDIERQEQLWQGEVATALAVSADGRTVAAVDRDAGQAIVYGIEGEKKGTVSFKEKRQRIPPDDSMGNPQDSLLAFSADGRFLAAGFEDGSLDIFDTATGEARAILPKGDAVHFEGGFTGGCFAFSATSPSGQSVFAAVDMEKWEQTAGFQSGLPFGVSADENGLFVSSENLLVRMDPKTGEQKELAYPAKDITAFAAGKGGTLAALESELQIFDQTAGQIGSFSAGYPLHFLGVSGELALAAGRDSPQLHILRRKEFEELPCFSYEADYPHDEARLNEQGDRLMLFSYRGFRLYDREGRRLCEGKIPDPQRVYDQQFFAESGNLAVLYPDALRIYSGKDGKLIYEKTGLRSVFYAPYGISILEQSGALSLVNPNTAQAEEKGRTDGSFAAWCGLVVEDSFLSGRRLTGAVQTEEGYLLAVSGEEGTTVYDGQGQERFHFSSAGEGESIFAGGFLLFSPQHGTPAAYRLSDGKKLRELLPETFMTRAASAGDGLICEYITTDGERFGLLLDDRCETVASLPGITDTAEGQVYFDYDAGYIRGTQLYPLEQLVLLAQEEIDGDI